MPSNLITLNHTTLNDKYLIVSFVRELPQGDEYMVRYIYEGTLMVARVYHAFAIRAEEDFAAFEDYYFKARELEHDSLQKPHELFRFLLPGMDHMFPVVIYKLPEGQTLQALMQADVEKSLPEAVAGKVAYFLCDAMQAIHDAGLVHGNLSPECIYWDEESEALTLCRVPWIPPLDGPVFKEDSQQKFYAPAEVWSEGSFNQASDIYALGCLLHELLEGTPPYTAPDQRTEHGHGDCPGLHGISSAINKAMLQCLNLKPGKRPKSFKALQSSFKRYAKASGAAGDKKGSKGTILLLLLLLALGGGGYGYFEFVMKPEQQKVARERKLREEQDRQRQQVAVTDVANSAEEQPATEEVIATEGPEIEGMAFFAGGRFNMGSEQGFADASAVHAVTLSPFYLDLTEVTHEQYHAYVQSGGPAPKIKNPRQDLWRGGAPTNKVLRQPMIFLNWEMARGYCNSVGKRLPTEAEWEFAARGTEGREWPWGSAAVHPTRAQYDMDWDGDETIYEVDFFQNGRSPEGLFNLVGGVREWVQDWYDPDYYTTGASKDPTGPKTGEKKVLRGSSWQQPAEPLFARDFLNPEETDNATGVRCAKSLQP